MELYHRLVRSLERTCRTPHTCTVLIDTNEQKPNCKLFKADCMKKGYKQDGHNWHCLSMERTRVC